MGQLSIFGGEEGGGGLRARGPTLRDAQVAVESGKWEKDGCACPCCGQRCKVYPRTVNAPMARLLVWLVRAYRREARWYNVHEFPLIQGRRGGGDFAKMVFWGLLAERPKGTDQDQRTSGFWMPTELGIRFAQGYCSIPRYAFIFNDQVEEWSSEERVSIQDCLGTDFSFTDLFEDKT